MSSRRRSAASARSSAGISSRLSVCLHTQKHSDPQEFHWDQPSHHWRGHPDRTIHPSRGSWEKVPCEHRCVISDAGESFPRLAGACRDQDNLPTASPTPYLHPREPHTLPDPPMEPSPASPGGKRGHHPFIATNSCCSHPHPELPAGPGHWESCRGTLSPSTSPFPNFQRAGFHL